LRVVADLGEVGMGASTDKERSACVSWSELARRV